MAIRQRGWKAETRVNFSGFTELADKIKEGLVVIGSDPKNPFNIAIRKWGEQYRSFLKHRFNRLKKPEGGEWRKIAERTHRWRIKKHNIRHRQILYVTRTLYKLTDKKYNPAKGHYAKKTKYGATIGVAGYKKHPDYPGTIYRLVKFHAKGNAITPKRRIIVKPDQPTIDKMHKSMTWAMKRLLTIANKKVKAERSS